MKLLAVMLAHKPGSEEFMANIPKYIPYIEHLIIWDNTPDLDLLVGLAYAENRIVEQAVREGRTQHILTMDKNIKLDGFKSYHIEHECQECATSPRKTHTHHLNIN